ncbi:glycosyltransferase family 2 protein [Lusitaniella coriacea]|uniref:glycosyltransferase family 2 protein n=1 Tax=Lusitaniella coriacea TaxID=1983105 RepID=UPI003CF03BE7
MVSFSIVITTYNRLSFLEKAIEKSLNQTQPCEVVIVDDCSNDGTEEYVRSLKDPRIVYHRNPQNLGHSPSVNEGVRIASGEWIKFLDDDDYLAPNCIEVMSKVISQHPQAAICSAQAFQIDPEGTELSCTQKVGQAPAFFVLQEDIHYGMLIEMLPFGTPVQVAAKKTAFFQSGGWDVNLNGNYDDIDSWIKIAEHGDALFINQPLAYRTIHPGCVTQQLSLEKRLKTNIDIKQKIYDRVHDKYKPQLPKSNDVQKFLELYWGLVGLKEGKIFPALRLIYPSLFSPTTFGRLAQTMYQRRLQKQALKLTPESETKEPLSLSNEKLFWVLPPTQNQIPNATPTTV